ncbi:SusE domain-containing protein [Fibrella aquatilis]|uniref:SusF/SusE family outer membrane protein n=1 Tax=Fibrella aquatilis TaxID=2817059 RepID=A0A939K2I7_9BACT|nr:SusE domain-containing protein [Fibrella aquatilis]MBO0934121.1 SusF/SusE family outer membrane protein [Fibrella aquatilis]
MFKHLQKLALFGVALGLLASCEKEGINPVLDTTAIPVVSVSAPTVVLTKENGDKGTDALTVNWSKPNYGFDAPANYTLMVDKKGGDFSKAVSINLGTASTKTFKTAELNKLILGLGIAPAATADLDMKVMSALGGSTVLSSALATVKATTYLDKLDLSTIWGVVGSATANSWDGPDQPFYKTANPNEIVAYVGLKDGEIKFRQNNKWDVNLGGTPAKLTLNGDNIAVKAGTYKITLNPTVLTYKIEPFTWGVVGAATANGWNGPDQPFMYDASTDQWRAIVSLKADEFKFRQNNDWAVNFGGGAGKLVSAGDNLKVAAAGLYLITADFNKLTYKVEPYNSWGIVGSATPKGWDGPDVNLMPDFANEGVYFANGVKLVDGDIKFRQNNKWDVEYGGANGALVAKGANIAVKAGTYDVKFDLSTNKYTLTKK